MRRHSYRYQRTLARPAEVEGIGFLTGATVRAALRPRPAGHRRRLRPHRLCAHRPHIPARIDQVTGTQRRTTLGRPPGQVGLVEHVLAALAGLRIDNCYVELNAPEPPGLDGSARRFVDALRAAGTVLQPARRAAWTVERTVVVAHNGAHPGDPPRRGRRVQDQLSARLRSRHRRSPARCTRRSSRRSGSPTRWRRAAPSSWRPRRRNCGGKGSGRGTTAADLLVFGRGGPIDNRLRYGNEPARHKVLDLVGDLALFGHDLRGHVVAYRSGHPLNVELVRALSRELVTEGDAAADCRAAGGLALAHG